MTSGPKSWAVFVAVAPVYLVTANYSGNWANGDTLTAALAAWRLAGARTFNLAGTEPYPSAILWLVPGPHGSIVSNRFPGVVLAAVPSYLLSGARAFTPAPASATAALLAAAGVALAYRLLTETAGPAAAAAGAAVFAFGTAMWTVAGEQLWEHSATVPVLAGALLLARRERWAWCGVCLGSLIMFRPHLGVVGVVLAVAVWRRAGARPALSIALGMIPGLAGYLTWNWAVYGKLTLTGGYGLTDPSSAVTLGGVGPLHFLEGIAGTALSPERGLLVLCPILAYAALGLPEAWRRADWLVRAAALAGLAYLAVQLWVIRYSGGDGFIGSRVTLESVALTLPLLVAAARVAVDRHGQTWAWWLAAYSLALTAAGAAVGHGTAGINLSPWTQYPFAQLYGMNPRATLAAAAGALAAVYVARIVVDGLCQLHAVSEAVSE